MIVLSTIPIYTSVFASQGTGARLSMVTVFSDPRLQQISAEQVLLAKKQHNILNQLLYDRRIIFIPSIVKGYFDHFNFDFLFVHGDGGVQHHAYQMGMLYLWDSPFVIAGIIFYCDIEQNVFFYCSLFLFWRLFHLQLRQVPRIQCGQSQ